VWKEQNFKYKNSRETRGLLTRMGVWGRSNQDGGFTGRAGNSLCRGDQKVGKERREEKFRALSHPRAQTRASNFLKTLYARPVAERKRNKGSRAPKEKGKKGTAPPRIGPVITFHKKGDRRKTVLPSIKLVKRPREEENDH